MESRLQRKLREHREKGALGEISSRLSGLLTDGGLQPAWVGEAINGFWDITTDPVATLSDEASPEELDAWIEGLVAEHRLSGLVYVATHLGILPWLECRVPDRGWMTHVRDAVEEPWMFLSETLDGIVVVTEAEYCYEATSVMGEIFAPHANPRICTPG